MACRSREARCRQNTLWIGKGVYCCPGKCVQKLPAHKESYVNIPTLSLYMLGPLHMWECIRRFNQSPILLLTLGAHAPQGYSSWVCVCVCVCVSSSIFPKSNELARKTYGSPQRCNRLIYKVFFFVKQPSMRYKIWVAAVLVHRLAILLALQAPEPYPFTWRSSQPRGVSATGFAIVFCTMLYSARVYLHHWTLTLTMCNCSSEGRYGPI